MAKKIEIYTMTVCPFCMRAKKLLRRKDMAFEEINLSRDENRWEEVEKRSGRQTVPQIFVDGRHLGGCDDLYELEKKGELDTILGGNP